MQVLNNSTTKKYTVGGYTIDPGVQRFIPDEYYDDIQGLTDLQVIGTIPTDFLAKTLQPIYGVVDANGRITQVTNSSGSPVSGISGSSGSTYLGARVALLGDSNSAFGYEETAIRKAITNRCWFDYAVNKSKQKAHVVKRAGVSGNRIDQMLARFPTDIAPFRPTLVILQGGANDLDQGYSAEQAFVSVMGIYQACRAIGATLLYVNTTGRLRVNTGSPVSPIDGVQYKMSQEYAKLADLGRTAIEEFGDKGYFFFDISQAIRDYSVGNSNGALGSVLPGAVPDASHMVGFAHVLTGELIAPFLANDVLRGGYPDQFSGGGYGDAGDQNELVGGNSLMMGGVAFASTPGIDAASVVPDPFQPSRTGTGATIMAKFTPIARTDGGRGKMLQIDISGAGALTDEIMLRARNPFNLEVGRASYAQVEVSLASVTSGYVHKVTCELVFEGTAGAVLGRTKFGDDPLTPPDTTRGFTGLTGTRDFGLMRTPEFVVPAGAINAFLEFRVSSTIGAVFTLNIAGLGARKNTARDVIAKYR